ncbi:MAG: InlB B-repeat-containing protein [Christensenellaceae bacterium]
MDTAEVAYAAIIPTPGTAPDVEGYEFKEWVYSGNVYVSGSEQVLYLAMGDVTVTATYTAIKHKVKFYDGVTGNIITIKQVERSGRSPPFIEHEGYIFQGWDTDFSCVVEDLIVTGICTPLMNLLQSPLPNLLPNLLPSPLPSPHQSLL